MLEFFDAKNCLDHLVQLVLREDRLSSQVRLLLLLVSAGRLLGLLFSSQEVLELRHPRGQDDLLRATLGVREALDPLLDLLAKGLA